MTTRYPSFKAAAMQAASVFLNRDTTVDKAVSLIEAAAGDGARLIVFPERWIPGYPMWIWLGSPAWGQLYPQRASSKSVARSRLS